MVVFPCFLAFVVITGFRWVGPSPIALVVVIPNAAERVLALWPTKHRTWGAVPLGMCDAFDGHIWVDGTLHVGLLWRALIVLVALTKLAASVGQRILSAHQVPRVLVTSIILNCFLHGLSQEGSDVDEPIDVTVLHITFANVEFLPCNAFRCHYVKALFEVVIAVDARRNPLIRGRLIEKELVVYLVLDTIECVFHFDESF
mmetsp:Transcript_5000/g.10783  ORF Transcript_5000/g.10783 Transcript_5000/m.10783 type:complete len:201 (-) Transcript_5000:463-1065(-)